MLPTSGVSAASACSSFPSHQYCLISSSFCTVRTRPNSIVFSSSFCSSFSVGASTSVQQISHEDAQERHSISDPQVAYSVSFPPLKVAKRVVLVRHGQSTWNAEGRIQGSSNFSVLTAKGEAQAETSRQMLVNDAFDVCFVSPLMRSKRTAEIIWGARKEEMIEEYDLREIDLYSFQGLLKHEGKAGYGESFRKWQVDAPNFSIDGHYPVRELWDRARNCWTKILTQDSKSILVVAHNAVNQALIATAIGLQTKYFRVLLQSNCGVSVLDFIPRTEGESPLVCVNRLNQSPDSPVAAGKSGGRKASSQIILACQGSVQGNTDTEAQSDIKGDQPMNMLGIIQSQKTAELLLDLNVSTIVSSPRKACIETATTISKVQEAADCLGADCVPRYVEMKNMYNLDVEEILQQSEMDASNSLPGWLRSSSDELQTTLWNQAGQAWESVLHEISDKTKPVNNVIVVVGHPAIHIALMAHCLRLSKEWLGSFHLDAGSISVLDFPDGPGGQGVIRCINYTAHLGRWAIPITTSTMEDGEF